MSIIGQPVRYSDAHLHGVVFSTDNSIASILLIPPLFEERRCAHRTLVCTARALAMAGATVMVPDISGVGNSRGNLGEITLDDWLQDIVAAHAFLKNLAGPLPCSVIGCRAGALLAAVAIARGLPVQQFLLWHPVTSGRAYLAQLHTRRMIQDKMTGDAPPITGQFEVEGQELSPELHANLDAMRLPADMPQSVRLCLLQCSFNEKLLTEYARLRDQWGEMRLLVRHIVCEPFWHSHSPGDYHEITQAVVAEVMA